MSTTQPMIAPDGSTGDIPSGNINDAVKAGFKLATPLTSPDGKLGYVPVERVTDAYRAGFKPVQQPSSQQEAPDNTGFMGTIGNKIVDAAKSLVPPDPTGGRSLLDPKAWYDPSTAKFDPKSSPVYQEATSPIPEGTPTQVLGAGNKTIGDAIYRGAKTLSPLVPGLNPQASEQAAAKGDTGAVAAEAAVPLAASLAPSAAHAASPLVSDLLNKIPSAARAGQAFKELSGDIGTHPVQIDADLGKSLTDIRQASATTNTNIPPVVRKLIDRVDPFQGNGPLTYDEARAFSSEINNLSASDKLSMTANTKRLVGSLNQTLKSAVQNTADVAGQGPKLSQAMNEYRQVMQARGVWDESKELAWKTAVGALGLGAGSALAKKVWGMVP